MVMFSPFIAYLQPIPSPISVLHYLNLNVWPMLCLSCLCSLFKSIPQKYHYGPQMESHFIQFIKTFIPSPLTIPSLFFTHHLTYDIHVSYKTVIWFNISFLSLPCIVNLHNRCVNRTIHLLTFTNSPPFANSTSQIFTSGVNPISVQEN